MENKHTCRNCAWLDEWWGSCFNGESENRGELMDINDYCNAWEQKEDKGKEN